MAIDHFIKHPHARERTDWNFNILFDDQPQAAALARQYKPLLKHPGLYEPVPGKWLHATVLRVGFLEEFNEQEMLAVVKLLEPQLVKLQIPLLLLGQWFLWDGNPCLRITPDTQLQEVLRLIVTALNEVVGTDRAPQKIAFKPHITLAYSRSYDDEAGLRRQLETKHIKAAPIRASNVSLIKQRVEDNHYVWDVVKIIQLSQHHSLIKFFLN